MKLTLHEKANCYYANFDSNKTQFIFSISFSLHKTTTFLETLCTLLRRYNRRYPKNPFCILIFGENCLKTLLKNLEDTNQNFIKFLSNGRNDCFYFSWFLISACFCMFFNSKNGFEKFYSANFFPFHRKCRMHRNQRF